MQGVNFQLPSEGQFSAAVDRQNGKVERLNRSLATEWAYRQTFASNANRAAALAPWIENYNTARSHTLGGKPPISRCDQRGGRVHLGAVSLNDQCPHRVVA